MQQPMIVTFRRPCCEDSGVPAGLAEQVGLELPLAKATYDQYRRLGDARERVGG